MCKGGNMNDKELINECLLTPGEQAPFVHTDLVDYGDTTVGEEVWDIEGLLNAQLAKAIPLISAEARKQERERIVKKAEGELYPTNTYSIGRRVDSFIRALKEGKEAE